MSRRLLAAGALVAVALAAGCTSSGGHKAPTAPVTLPNPLPSVSITPVPTPASTPVGPATPVPQPTPTATPRSSGATLPNPLPRTSLARPTPAPTVLGDGCAATQLRVSTARGGAFQGREFAAIVFTNISRRSCALRGYPAAQLVHGDQPLGRPATHSGNGRVATIQIAPGHAAQAALSAISTCQSPLSDHVQVSAPGTNASFNVPVQLRGCALSVDPVEPG